MVNEARIVVTINQFECLVDRMVHGITGDGDVFLRNTEKSTLFWGVVLDDIRNIFIEFDRGNTDILKENVYSTHCDLKT